MGTGGGRKAAERGGDLSALPKDTNADARVMAWRAKHEITVAGGCSVLFETFDEAPLPPRLLVALKGAGFAAPSAIQSQAWPPALEDRDVIGVAKTGSGKTLGFLVPAFKMLCGNNPGPMPAMPNAPRVLVLAPTRELATQIADEAVKFGRPLGIQTVCCYGGAPKGMQLGELRRGAHVVIATPGRLNDFLEGQQVSMHQVQYLVFDEADRMLDMGFEPQIRKVVAKCPSERQTLFFTATWPREVRALASEFLARPVVIYVGDTSGALKVNKDINQRVYVTRGQMEKDRLLADLIRQETRENEMANGGPCRIIVFSNAKRQCDTLERQLPHAVGLRCAAMHGDKDQHQRTQTINAFKAGVCPVLIATDVAARGLDIKEVRAVINYDFPNNIEDYVHRVGRTGRAGAKGNAHTFFTQKDDRKAQNLAKLLSEAGAEVPEELARMASGAGQYAGSTMQFSRAVGGSYGGGGFGGGGGGGGFGGGGGGGGGGFGGGGGGGGGGRPGDGMCGDFQRGRCTRGAACRFSHGDGGGGGPPPVIAQPYGSSAPRDDDRRRRRDDDSDGDRGRSRRRRSPSSDGSRDRSRKRRGERSRSRDRDRSRSRRSKHD